MRRRRAILITILSTAGLTLLAGAMPAAIRETFPKQYSTIQQDNSSSHQPDSLSTEPLASTALEELQVKGRAPKTGYERSQFGNGWGKYNGCSTRDIILYRDLKNVTLEGECTILSGVLYDPYTGDTIEFSKSESSKVQIDHVVALSDAWQKGAQLLTIEQRKQLANDPLELLAVDGQANQNKSDGDAATWLPKNKTFRCAYVARQIAVKKKYMLWISDAEKSAMKTVLAACPNERLP